MFGWDLAGIADSTPVMETSTKAVFNNLADHEVYTFTGKNFTYDGLGQPTGGLITGFELETNGASNFSISGARLQVTDLLAYVQEEDVAGLMTQVFSGDDAIRGSAVADGLGGYDGDDVINGGRGNDQLWGGRGKDALAGGAGSDKFLYLNLSESRGAAADTISDLQKSDWIDLSAIDANSSRSGDQHFRLVEAFTHHAGELALVYDEAHDRTKLMLDVNGDARADGLVYLSGDQTAFTHFVL
jgi:Ca2+-binding RTX toxin-like protein